MKNVVNSIASALQAWQNCKESGNTEWRDKHEETVERLVKEYMPSGSGFDNGTTLDFGKSEASKRLVFATSFHHMNEHGFYTEWTHHTVTVKPDLVFGFTIHVGGRDRNSIKDYIEQAFRESLACIVKD